MYVLDRDEADQRSLVLRHCSGEVDSSEKDSTRTAANLGSETSLLSRFLYEGISITRTDEHAPALHVGSI